MSRRHGTWVYGCPIFVMAFAIFFVIINPIIAVMVAIIAALTIAIIYIHQSDSHEEPQSTAEEPVLTPDFTNEVLVQADKGHSVSEVTPFPFQTLDDGEKTEATAVLQQRIEELERRVQSLKEELARDPSSVAATRIIPSETFEENGENDEEDLSEKAVQQLLETLEEKLAKGAITEQLYTRLRDKYIERIKKTKRKREASSKKRGKKDSSTGDK